MKMCDDPEQAMHYDCMTCDEENCKYRRDNSRQAGLAILLLCVSIIYSIILMSCL